MNVEQIIDKVEKTEVPEVKKVAIAYSGGLDSSLGIVLLRRKYKAQEILPITVDVGQGDEELCASRE
ncbi:argininosuccinate synthase, partial [bacterium]|nr:argininosuccinate synthase [bacterium]